MTGFLEKLRTDERTDGPYMGLSAIGPALLDYQEELNFVVKTIVFFSSEGNQISN